MGAGCRWQITMPKEKKICMTIYNIVQERFCLVKPVNEGSIIAMKSLVSFYCYIFSIVKDLPEISRGRSGGGDLKLKVENDVTLPSNGREFYWSYPGIFTWNDKYSFTLPGFSWPSLFRSSKVMTFPPPSNFW